MRESKMNQDLEQNLFDGVKSAMSRIIGDFDQDSMCQD